MHIVFYNAAHLEKWNWQNPSTLGIGGSETGMVEMAWRLAARGHKITCYCPLAGETNQTWRNTEWKDISQVDFTVGDLWIFVRTPGAVTNLTHGNQKAWILCQDVDYFDLESEEVSKRCEKVIALCPTHKKYIEHYHPLLKGKVDVSSNGIKTELINSITSVPCIVPRNPKRLMYASSPDRGLLNLLPIFKRAREFVPDLELHCFYGRENMITASKMDAPHAIRAKHILKQLDKQIDQPNVFWHGRVNQETLWNEWRKSGLWVHPSTFTETSCITSMEAQALGAIPITNPLWAVGENVRFGTFLRGDPEFVPIIRARYVGEIIRYATSESLQNKIRPDMMAWAREKFDWEKVVDQWEGWMK